MHFSDDDKIRTRASFISQRKTSEAQQPTGITTVAHLTFNGMTTAASEPGIKEL